MTWEFIGIATKNIGGKEMNNFVINSLVVVKRTGKTTRVKVIMGTIYLCEDKNRYQDSELRYATKEEREEIESQSIQSWWK